VPIILAAGASTRMGTPKALCDFDGRSCLQLALDACREAGLARPIVVLGFWAAEISARVPLGAATIHRNALAHHGQTSSLKVGLQALPARAQAFLLYPVDFPLLTAEDLRPLLAAWRARRHDQRIFIPSHTHRRGHPVLFDATLRGNFLALDVAAPARAVVDARADEIVYVENDTPYVLMDMDTPQDYVRCMTEFRLRTMRRHGRDRRPAAGE
jgi:molybdenum cofactor cytidylyltransferase